MTVSGEFNAEREIPTFESNPSLHAESDSNSFSNIASAYAGRLSNLSENKPETAFHDLTGHSHRPFDNVTGIVFLLFTPTLLYNAFDTYLKKLRLLSILFP